MQQRFSWTQNCDSMVTWRVLLINRLLMCVRAEPYPAHEVQQCGSDGRMRFHGVMHHQDGRFCTGSKQSFHPSESGLLNPQRLSTDVAANKTTSELDRERECACWSTVTSLLRPNSIQLSVDLSELLCVTYVHDAVFLWTEEQPIIEECQLGVGGRHV